MGNVFEQIFYWIGDIHIQKTWNNVQLTRDQRCLDEEKYKMPFHTQSDWQKLKSLITPTIGENVGKQKLSDVASVNWNKHLGKQVGAGQPSCQQARPMIQQFYP